MELSNTPSQLKAYKTNVNPDTHTFSNSQQHGNHNRQPSKYINYTTHIHHSSALSKSFLNEKQGSGQPEKSQKRQVNTSFGLFVHKNDKNTLITEDIADNIEEDVNNTWRIGHKLKIEHNVNMVPSRPMKISSDKENPGRISLESTQQKLEFTMKKVMNETDQNRKFDYANTLFNLIITNSNDYKLTTQLKELKKIYDTKIEMLSNKVPQNEKKIREITHEIQNLQKENTALKADLKLKNSIIESQKNAIQELKIQNLNSTKKITSNQLSISQGEQKMKINAKLNKPQQPNSNDYDPPKSGTHETCSSNPGSACTKMKKIAIPKLDLSKVPKKFANEKLIIIPSKKKNKAENIYSTESDESESNDEIQIEKSKQKLDKTYGNICCFGSNTKENMNKLDLSMGSHNMQIYN